MLLGRSNERRRLDRCLDGAKSGHGGALLLTGDPGVGKSFLLDYARGEAAAAGLSVLETTGCEAESQLAYAGLHQLLWPLMPAVDDLRHAQAAALRSALELAPGEHVDPLSVFAATLTVLAQAGAERPVLCIVDDAQWLDRASLGVLSFVARRLDNDAVAMLFAARSADEGDVPIELPTLRLWGLPEDPARELLLNDTSVPVASRVATEIVAGTKGNPMAILELSHLLSDDELAGRAPLPEPLPLGADLERVFLDKVRHLEPATQQFLLLAASADPSELGAIVASARALDIGLPALHDAERHGLLQTTTNRVVFRHPLIRSAVYQGATAVARARAHSALASALSGDKRGGTADRRAWHLAAATLEPDEAIASELEEMALRASRRAAHAESAHALRRAAELSGNPDARGRRLLAAGEQAWASNEPNLAEALLEKASSCLSDPPSRARAALIRGEIATGKNDPFTGTAVLVEAADEIFSIDEELGLDILVSLAALVLLMPTAAGEFVERVDRLVPQAQDTFTAEFLRASARLLSRPLAESASLAPFAMEDRTVLPTYGREYLITFLAQTHPTSDPINPKLFDRKARWIATARREARIGPLLFGLTAFGFDEILAGRYKSARADLTEAITLSRDAGQPAHEHLAMTNLAILEACEGNTNKAITLADETIRSAPDSQVPHIAGALWGRGLAELGAGDADAAFATLTQIAPGGSLESLWCTPLAAPDLIEAAVTAGHTEAAEEYMRSFGAWADCFAPPYAKALAARCRALTAEDDAARGSHFEHALEVHEDAGRPLDRARTRLHFGEYLRRARRHRDAREQLLRALAAFEQLGARAWADRAARELRAAGRSPRRWRESSLDRLTPQELQVARFVARGHTNKDVAAQLFISPRTVSSHLQRVFTKLDVTNRTQLAQYDFEGVAPVDETWSATTQS